MSEAGLSWPEGVVPVPVVRSGRNRQAREDDPNFERVKLFAVLDQEDYAEFVKQGATLPWRLARHNNTVFAGFPYQNLKPAWWFILRPRNDQTVKYKDGDPTNLTKDNLTLVVRPLTDRIHCGPLS